MERNVTITCDEYEELVQKGRELDNLLNFIFENAALVSCTNQLEFNDYLIEKYLKAVFKIRYANKVYELKKKE